MSGFLFTFGGMRHETQLAKLSELTAQLGEIVRVNRDEIIALKKKVHELEGAVKKQQAFNPYRPIVYK